MARNAVDRLETIDLLPEQTVYRDEGCGNGCVRSLECPFPRCRYDDPLLWQRTERDQRDAKIVAARRREGLSVDDLASRFGISRRTVHRILARSRQEGRQGQAA
jgi:hypothetical protein